MSGFALLRANDFCRSRRLASEPVDQKMLDALTCAHREGDGAVPITNWAAPLALRVW